MLLKANIDWNQMLQKYMDVAISLAGKLIVGLLIIFVGFKLIQILVKIVKTALEKADIDYGVISFSCSFLKIALRCVVIFMAVSNVGVGVSSIVALLVLLCRVLYQMLLVEFFY